MKLHFGSPKAQIKKAKKMFQVGDIVTWGNELFNYKVVAVEKDSIQVYGPSNAGDNRNFWLPLRRDPREYKHGYLKKVG